MNADVLVVGAGVAGLACARELVRQGRRVLVIDRAGGVGGRCASKTLHGHRVDYGPAFLHGSSPHFLGLVEQLESSATGASLLTGWPHAVREARLACQPAAFQPGQRRMAVREGVSALPRMLAAGLDLRPGTTIHLVRAMKGGFEALTTDGRYFTAPRLVLALAGPQTLRLLEPLAGQLSDARVAVEDLSAIPYAAALTLVAGYSRSEDPGFDIWYPLETTILHAIIHDSAKRPGGSERVMVLQARPRYSQEHADVDSDEWARDLAWEAGEVLGRWAGDPAWSWSHRWRWARIPAGERALGGPRWLANGDDSALGLCGDAFTDATGVEGAFLSGVGLARQLAGLAASGHD